MNPDISIIVPVYNVQQYLRDCIESILNQCFSNFELILVNDGSTDKSGMICDEYSELDYRIKVIHKKYGGVSSARNAGLSAAKGDYIGFVDGDDRIEENMYHELYRICKEKNCDISICKLGREINGELLNIKEENFEKVFSHLEAMRELFIGNLYRFSLCNKLFHKKCFDNIHFPDGRIHEDLSTTYKLFSNANRVVYLNFVGYIYVKRENSILTSRFNKKRLDAFLGWEEILPFMKENYPQLSNEVHACFAYFCVDNGYYILHQVTDKKERKKYLLCIQSSVRNFYKGMIKNDALSVKYKNIISIINFSVSLFIFSNSLNHLRKLK